MLLECPNCDVELEWTGSVLKCPKCGAEYEDDDDGMDIPEGCAACGGEYPLCKDSCPMFDD